MSTRVSACSSYFFCLALALSTPACSNETAEQGELMLSVTTDMAVPTDIDHVIWSVTLDGEATPYATDSVELASATDLPLTLAIQAGPKTVGPVKVRVEGAKGPKLSRVAREARLVVPKDRVTKLELPLSWLCSSANLAEPCAAGTTCKAGQCVDAAVTTASLADFEPTPTGDCYDVPACLQSPNLTLMAAKPLTLTSGGEVPCGIIGTKPLGPDADVSVALEVSNEQVGNYGFCLARDATGATQASGKCFIPLRRSETEEGWHVLDNGDTPAIELPPAVCEDSQTSILNVAIIRSSPSCPADDGDSPLCPSPWRGCLPAQDTYICPQTSPSPAWVGYACSDANPQEQASPLLSCWSPSLPAVPGETPTDGRWCCLQGQPPRDDDPLLIDDMQDGPQIKLAPPDGHTAGWWYTLIADGSGDLSPAPEPSLYTYRQFDEPVGPPDGPKLRAAACLSSQGFHGWVALQGFNFESGPRMDARDVREYAGISFFGWAREPFPDDPLAVTVSFPNVQASYVRGSACDSGKDTIKRCDTFSKEVTLTGEWKRYFVRWEELAQSEDDWGQIRFQEAFEPEIYGVAFMVMGAGLAITSQPFDFCIADIRFEQQAESPP